MSLMDEFYRPCVPTSSTRSSPTVPPPGVDLTANLARPTSPPPGSELFARIRSRPTTLESDTETQT